MSMITTFEWRNSDGYYELLSSFHGYKPWKFDEMFRDAYTRSDNECTFPLVAITVCDEEGDFQDADCYSDLSKAESWWKETCSN